MRILLLHNRYQLAGGEDHVVQLEKSLLESHGHEVSLLEVSNQDITQNWDKVKAAFNAIYSYSAKKKVGAENSRFTPDIVHVHNFFPLLSPSVYDACNFSGIPVVQTLHNYRLTCPKATLFRDNKICEDCIDKVVPWPSIVHGCYRGSRIQTSAVTTMLSWHQLRGTWQNNVNGYIVLTAFQKNKMIQAGLPKEKIYVKPNFIFNPNIPCKRETQEKYLLFVGRLSEEKGISLLIDAYIQNNIQVPLKIVGDGPLYETIVQKIRAAGFENLIELLGFQNPSKVLSLMSNAHFLIFPSVWYEGFPMTILEAFTCKLPVIISKLGSMAEIVQDQVTGLHFEANNGVDLAEKIQWAIAHPESRDLMGENAYLVYQDKYSPDSNYQQIIKIYQQIIERTHEVSTGRKNG
jgi:glycosyltransferase involved in cell wall biosynthesis